MRPTKVEFNLGNNVHGQPVRLVREADDCWRLVKDAVSQRDQTDTIGGLTREQLSAIQAALDSPAGAR